jgi:hypothetical protein
VSLGEASTMVQARMRVPFYPASTVPSRTWPAERCPLCAEGTPYTDPLSGHGDAAGAATFEISGGRPDPLLPNHYEWPIDLFAGSAENYSWS